ncbi:Thioredoxin-like fold protein [Cordyceps fumosorosea ARSEF 2679]|uniref:Thioredoxin-like fold protein n=1 Tax=Cordyceps fumosorosea (strain ARSEF 2679) TaxID=1081104 RepID=A0A167MJB4_CORFA|nr:Thioredoxin-like fold protein [Cordyceps fumosorosea ARSEF 2679]OAA54423.1 Thioredoxin-like fold protein [Cordyceps fumosorosea ARSEF 2679]
MADSTENSGAHADTPQRQSGFWAEIESLKTPEKKEIAEVPKVGAAAPSSNRIPLPDGKPTVIVFLRHCGCPFAEKVFKNLSKLSHEQPGLHCIAVSHSSTETTEKWIPEVGGAWSTDVVIDEARDLYAQWGLGLSSVWHMSGPSVLYAVYRLGTDEGVWNRPTESGTRWQIGGAFAVDGSGVVRYVHMAQAANDLPDLQAAAQAVGIVSQEEDLK